MLARMTLQYCPPSPPSHRWQTAHLLSYDLSPSWTRPLPQTSIKQQWTAGSWSGQLVLIIHMRSWSDCSARRQYFHLGQDLNSMHKLDMQL